MRPKPRQAAAPKCQGEPLILDTDKLQYDDAYRADMRHRFVSDGFFAAELLGFNDFNRRAHGPVFNRLYFPKNPNLPIRDQHKKHKRLHLDPRHTFKTTAKRVDRAQWIAAFPEEMTVLVESATQPLAQASAQKTALLFYKPRGASPRPLHLMFPELVTDRYPEVPWNTPNRRGFGPGDLDFTLAFTSPLSTQSGWHPLLIEPDDVEDTKNSGISASAEVRQSVIDVCDQNENLLRDGGFINISGTRYHPFDWYSKCIDRALQNPEGWEVLIRPSLILKNGGQLLRDDFPPEDEMELQFPEFMNLSYEELREKFYANYESFQCQQMNSPTGGGVQRFEERFYDAAQIVPGRIPRNGETFICWRPRYGGNKRMARYSEGAAARIVDDRIFILDAWQGTYTPSGEAEKIVAQCRAHDVDGLMMLAVPGSEYLMAHVRNEALRRNRSVKMQWLDFEDDENRRNGKREQLEPMIKAGRVLFSTAMNRAKECRKQFVFYGLADENGIIDCISHFADLVPLSLMRASIADHEIETMRKRRDDALLSQFLEQQGYDPVDDQRRRQTEASLEAMARTMTFGLPPLPGGLDG